MADLILSFPLLVSLVVFLLLLEGIFSGSEIALLSADPLSLKRKSQKGILSYRLAYGFVSKPSKLFATSLIGTSVCVIFISSLITIYLERQNTHPIWAVVWSSSIVVFFGELIPKTLARRFSDIWLPYGAYFLSFFYYSLYPLTRFFSILNQKLSSLSYPVEKLFFGSVRTIRDELKDLVDFHKTESELRTHEKRTIHRILDFRDLEAKDAMIPLVQIELISSQATNEEALMEFKRHRYSKMPVFEDRVDRIVSILDIRAFLDSFDKSQSIGVFAYKPLYVPATYPLKSLLRDFLTSNQPLAIVVDEYGGSIGMVTQEDTLEKLVGDIQDEDDQEVKLIRNLSSDSWSIQARITCQALEEKLQIRLPEGEYETLAGFLIEKFDRIPQIGEETEIELDFKYIFSIIHSSDKQIITVRCDRFPTSRK